MSVSVFQLKKQKTEAAFAKYHELRISLGSANNPPSTEAIDEILQAAGKSWSQLQSDVQRYELRQAVKAELEAMNAAKARRDELIAKIQARNAEFEELRRKHEESLHPLRCEIGDIANQLIHETDARRRFKDLRWTEWDDQIGALAQQAERAGAIFDQASRAVAKAESDLYTAQNGGSKMREELNLPTADILAKRLENAKAERDQASQIAADARKRHDELSARVNAM